jgi:TRAP-type C4-dicarboxylate transport system permease small subunit
MKYLEKIAAAVFGLAILGLSFAVAVETVMRKVFNTSLQGVDELGGYVLAVISGLAFALALISRAHIRIDIVHDHLPKPLRVVLNIIALPTIAACAVAALVMAWIAFTDSIAYNATAQTPWATPLKIPQGAWVASLAVFALVALLEVARLTGLVLTGCFDVIDRSYGPRGTKDELEDELKDMKARGVISGDITTPGAPRS